MHIRINNKPVEVELSSLVYHGFGDESPTYSSDPIKFDFFKGRTKEGSEFTRKWVYEKPDDTYPTDLATVRAAQTEAKFYYRYVGGNGVDGPKPDLLTFIINRETLKGVYVRFPNGNSSFEKWICHTHKKKFAYPTKEEAWNSFVHRTNKRVEILRNNLKYAEKLQIAMFKIKANRARYDLQQLPARKPLF